MMTTTTDALDYSEAQLRCRVDTASRLSPDVVDRLFGAAFDVIALGNIIASSEVVMRPLYRAVGAKPVPDYYFQGQIDFSNSVAMPIRRGLRYSRQGIQLVSVSYRNPIEIAATLGAMKSARGISGFINNLMNGVAQRRSLNTSTDATLIGNAVLEATIDVSVDERFAQLESAELDNALKREELERAKIHTDLARLHLAEEVYKLQAAYSDKDWTLEQMAELMNNIRLIESVKAMAALGLVASVGQDGKPQDDQSRDK